MKKIIIVLALLLIPITTGASLDTNLYYGLQNNSDVRELQEFLINKGLLKVSATGNFLSLTLSAVKNYQASKGIIQTGYVGPLTRTAINNESSAQLTVPATMEETIASLQAQIALLTKQLQVMQAQRATPPVVVEKIKGCMDVTASNYNSSAKENDGSCIFSNVTIETDRTYFMRTTGENFVLQTLVYEVKPSPYYYKPYSQPTEIDYKINEGNLIFLTNYRENSCIGHLSVAGCSDNSYQYYVEPNITIPKDSVLNIVDLPDKIATGAFYLISVVFKGATTGKIVTLHYY